MNEKKIRKPNVLKRLYDWIISLSGHKQSAWALFGVSFAESSFFPIPPDPLLMAMALARPRKALKYAAVCTLGSVVGGVFGYFLGYCFFSSIIEPLIGSLGMSSKWFGDPEGVRVLAQNISQMVESGAISIDIAPQLKVFLANLSPVLDGSEFYTNGLFFKGIVFFNQYGSLTVFVAAFTVIPYKVFTISSGLFCMPLLSFVLASIIGRGIRFFGVSTLFFFFGEKIEPWISKNLEWIAVAFGLLIVLGFMAMKML